MISCELFICWVFVLLKVKWIIFTKVCCSFLLFLKSDWRADSGIWFLFVYLISMTCFVEWFCYWPNYIIVCQTIIIVICKNFPIWILLFYLIVVAWLVVYMVYV